MHHPFNYFCYFLPAVYQALQSGKYENNYFRTNSFKRKLHTDGEFNQPKHCSKKDSNALRQQEKLLACLQEDEPLLF